MEIDKATLPWLASKNGCISVCNCQIRIASAPPLMSRVPRGLKFRANTGCSCPTRLLMNSPGSNFHSLMVRSNPLLAIQRPLGWMAIAATGLLCPTNVFTQCQVAAARSWPKRGRNSSVFGEMAFCEMVFCEMAIGSWGVRSCKTWAAEA